jgi:uncharacterized protein (TIGR03083 family)
MTDALSPELQPLIAAEYAGLADALDQVPAADWDKPSMCEGWRVRELVAHLTMPARYDQEAFMAQLRARDFDFAQLSNDIAAQDGQLPPASLVADLRDDTLHHWAPPEAGYHGALNHVVIHGLDATVPLDLGRRPADETMRIALDDLTISSFHAHFGTSIEGRRLEATDLEWSYGSGEILRAASADLVMALSGRRVPAGRLEGEPL